MPLAALPEPWGAFNNNYPFWNVDSFRPAALRKGLHAMRMPPLRALPGGCLGAPKSALIIERVLTYRMPHRLQLICIIPKHHKESVPREYP